MFMSPAVDLRLKPPNIGILVLQTKYECMAIEHSSSTEYLYGYGFVR
jgi:hypothetical protein